MSRRRSPLRGIRGVPRAGGRSTSARIARLALVLGGALGGILGGARAHDGNDNPHGRFRDDCALCHESNSWSPAVIDERFDHDALGYPLEGAHRDAPCLLCHLTLEFRETTGAACVDCHRDPHLGELGPDCARCHTVRDFRDPSADRRMHRTTRFPLRGVHATVDCGDCHDGGATGSPRFVNTPTDCWSCHADEWRHAANPDHAAASFPTDCTACHTEFAWGGAGFDHSVTGFPLTGAHRSVGCAECHPGFVFAGAPADCHSCHANVYAATTSPPHGPAGFPTDCALCHDTSSWFGADFDHAATAFPLTGAHGPLDCVACHSGNVYVGLDTACIACHQADWDGTDDPNHAAAGFSMECTECHSTSTWEDADFDHDGRYFPIDRGKHRPFWDTCSDCHPNPTAYRDFSCFGCHPHDDQGKTDGDHSEVSGYFYLSPECLRCHPEGED